MDHFNLELNRTQKCIIFSHESDIDGLGSVVLSKLAFAAVDYVLVPNIYKLENVFRERIESGNLDKYDKIYVTDLSLYEPALTMVANSSLREKVQIFDHHKKAIDDNMHRYEFTKVIEESDNRKRCGTELFYEYLIQQKLIVATAAMNEFVELTRLEDTWDWKKSGKLGEKAHDLAILLNVLGIEKYISTMRLKLLNNSKAFDFDENETALIQSKKNEYDKLLYSIMESAEYFLDENENKYGIVFADYEYRNELAEYVKKNGNPENIKYLIVVALNKGAFGQKSYRTIENNFDVNEVAANHGGGGHKEAASVNITEEQKVLALLLTRKEGLKYIAESKY